MGIVVSDPYKGITLALRKETIAEYSAEAEYSLTSV
jgi:hypothetical protein